MEMKYCLIYFFLGQSHQPGGLCGVVLPAQCGCGNECSQLFSVKLCDYFHRLESTFEAHKRKKHSEHTEIKSFV